MSWATRKVMLDNRFAHHALSRKIWTGQSLVLELSQEVALRSTVKEAVGLPTLDGLFPINVKMEPSRFDCELHQTHC